jgi:hypothetical protein
MMNAYRSLGCLVLLMGGACGEPSELEDVDVDKLAVFADFDPELSNPRAIASLSYEYDGEDCPDLSITAHVDDVAFLESPNGTGRVSEGCQVGFFIAELPPAAAESTIRFSDGVTEASFAVAHLLEPRSLAPSIAEGAVLSAGDRIDFTWSVDTDEIAALDAFFVRGEEATQVEPELVDHQATVTVPSLPPGDWTLSLGVIARAAVIRCVGAPECEASVSGNGVLHITIQ